MSSRSVLLYLSSIDCSLLCHSKWLCSIQIPSTFRFTFGYVMYCIRSVGGSTVLCMMLARHSLCCCCVYKLVTGCVVWVWSCDECSVYTFYQTKWFISQEEERKGRQKEIISWWCPWPTCLVNCMYNHTESSVLIMTPKNQDSFSATTRATVPHRKCMCIMIHLIAFQLDIFCIASFPGSPLAPRKNRKGGGEPGINLHMISRHDDIMAIITKVVMELCSHVIGWLEELQY